MASVAFIAVPSIGISEGTTMARSAFRERFPDPVLEDPGLLAPRPRERALQFGPDLVGRAPSAARKAARSRRISASHSCAPRPMTGGGDQPGNRPPRRLVTEPAGRHSLQRRAAAPQHGCFASGVERVLLREQVVFEGE